MDKELQALHAEVERLRAFVVLVYPYVSPSAPADVLAALEEEMNGGPGWRDRVGAAYARRNVQ